MFLFSPPYHSLPNNDPLTLTGNLAGTAGPCWSIYVADIRDGDHWKVKWKPSRLVPLYDFMFPHVEPSGFFHHTNCGFGALSLRGAWLVVLWVKDELSSSDWLCWWRRMWKCENNSSSSSLLLAVSCDPPITPLWLLPWRTCSPPEETHVSASCVFSTTNILFSSVSGQRKQTDYHFKCSAYWCKTDVVLLCCLFLSPKEPPWCWFLDDTFLISISIKRRKRRFKQTCFDLV